MGLAELVELGLHDAVGRALVGGAEVALRVAAAVVADHVLERHGEGVVRHGRVVRHVGGLELDVHDRFWRFYVADVRVFATRVFEEVEVLAGHLCVGLDECWSETAEAITDFFWYLKE